MNHNAKNLIISIYLHDPACEGNIEKVSQKLRINKSVIENVVKEHEALVGELGNTGELILRQSLSYLEMDYSRTTSYTMNRKKKELKAFLENIRSQLLGFPDDSTSQSSDHEPS